MHHLIQTESWLSLPKKLVRPVFPCYDPIILINLTSDPMSVSFLGYSTSYKGGYKCISPNGGLIVSKDVVFNEPRIIPLFSHLPLINPPPMSKTSSLSPLPIGHHNSNVTNLPSNVHSTPLNSHYNSTNIIISTSQPISSPSLSIDPSTNL